MSGSSDERVRRLEDRLKTLEEVVLDLEERLERIEEEVAELRLGRGERERGRAGDME
jgi:chaperonin cofactor prefoldin